MEEYKITGMSCAACSSRVEKAVSSVSGVESCVVNLLTNSMKVSGNATSEDIISAVEKAGYGAQKKGEEQKNNYTETNFASETDVLKHRIIYSSAFLLMLMYFSMGNTMFNLPLPNILKNNPLALMLIQLLLCIVIMIINKKFFISGFKAVKNCSPNMDTLVSLGSMASFIYSLCIVFITSDLYVKGDIMNAKHQLHEIYF